MFAFVDARTAQSGPKRLEAAVGSTAKESMLTELEAEWNEYIRLAIQYTNAITESSLTSVKESALYPTCTRKTQPVCLPVFLAIRAFNAHLLLNQSRTSNLNTQAPWCRKKC